MSYKEVKEKVAILLRSHVFRSVAFLTTSSAASRLIALASLPIITRIYAPSAFGQFSIFVSTLGLLLPFVTLRFSAAIPLPRRSGVAINLFFLCLLVTVAVTVVATVCVASVMFLADYVDVSKPANYYWLIVAGLLGVGLFETLNAWALRQKQFKSMAVAQMSQSIWSVILKTTLGLLGLKAGGLIVGHIASMTAGVSSLARAIRKDIRGALRLVSIRRVRIVFSHYNAFPRFRLPAQFLLAFSAQFPVLFVAFFYGEEVVGQLGLALAFIAIPISMVGASLGQVFFAEIAELGKKQPKKIRSMVRSSLYSSIALIVLPVIVLSIVGPELFAFLFGDQWLLAGKFAQVLSLYVAVQFCAVPLVNTLSVFGNQASFLIINGIRVLLTIGAFCIAYFFQLEVVLAVILFGAILSAHYIFVIWSIFKLVDQECLRNAS